MKNSTKQQQQHSSNQRTVTSELNNAPNSIKVLSIAELAQVAGGTDATPAGPNEPGSGDRDIGFAACGVTL